MNSNTLNITIEVDDKGTPKIKKLGKEMETASDKGEKGFKRTNKSLGDFNGTVSSVSKSAIIAFAGITAGATALGVAGTALVLSAANQAKEIENLSRLANMGTVEFQNYAFATESVGINADKLGDISKDVRDKLGDFIATGGGEFADFFENVAPKIGLTAEELQGLSGPDVLIAVKDAMDAVNISAEEQVFYLESLANDSALLTPLLADNGAALKKQAAHASELGIALSTIESAKLLEAAATGKDLTGVLEALKNKAGAELAPAFVEVGNIAVDVASWMIGGWENIDLVFIGLVDGIVTGWIDIKYGGQEAALTLTSVFGVAGDEILEAWAQMIEGMAESLDSMNFTIKNPFGDDWEIGFTSATETMRVHAENLRGASTATEDYRAASALLVSEKENELNAHNSIVETMVDEVLGLGKATEQKGQLKDTTKELSTALVEEGENWKKTGKAAEEAAATIEEFYESVADSARTTAEKEQHIIDEKYAYYKDAAEGNADVLVDIDQWYTDEVEKQAAKQLQITEDLAEDERQEAERLAADRATASRNMFTDMSGQAENHFATQVILLDAERQEYMRLVDDKSVVDLWYTEQYKILEDEKLLKTGEFFDGVRIGYEQLLKDQMTWAEAGLEITTTFAGQATSSLSNGLFAVVTGDFETLGEDWDGLWTGMLQTLTDILAKMAVEWATAKVVDFVSKYFHDGTTEIKDDETIAILQTGEMVIPREQSGEIRDNLGSSKTIFDDLATMSRIASETDGPASWGDPSGIDTVGSSFGINGIDTPAGTIESAFADAIEDEYEVTATAALGTAVATGDIKDFIGIMTSPDVALGNVMSAGGKVGMDVMGMDTPAGSAGYAVGGILGAALGLGAVGATLAALATAVAVEAVADYADVRDFEGFLDVMETHQGWFTAHFNSGMLGTGFSFEDIVDAGALDEFGEALEDIAKGTPGLGDGDDMGNLDDHSDMADPGDLGDTPGIARDGGIFDGPETGYPMILHGTEAVVPLKNGTIPVALQGADKKGADTVALIEEIRALRAEVQRGNFAIAKNTGQIARLIDRWEYDGMPGDRV